MKHVEDYLMKLNIIKLPEQEYKILFLTDLHMRDREFKNTVSYVSHQEWVLKKVIKGAQDGVYNVVITLGDFFDDVYRDVSKALYHINLVKQLSQAVNGHLYKVIGNHTLNRKKSNSLTMFLSGKVNSARIDAEDKTTMPTIDGIEHNIGVDQVFKVVDRLEVNRNAISLFHFNRDKSKYFDPTITKETHLNHIGAYHDAIANSRMRQYVSELSTDQRYVASNYIILENTPKLFSNIDYAVVGDIHTRIGNYKCNTCEGRTIDVDIPGSVARTQFTKSQQHNYVMLPIFTIKTTGELTRKHIKFNLLDYREIFKVNLIEEKKEEVKKLKGFLSALNILSEENESIQEIIRKGNLNKLTKNILSSLVEQGDYIPEYVKRGGVKF